MYTEAKVMYKGAKDYSVKVGSQLRAVLAMMATPLSWKSVFFCPVAKGRFTVKRRLALLELR